MSKSGATSYCGADVLLSGANIRRIYSTHVSCFSALDASFSSRDELEQSGLSDVVTDWRSHEYSLWSANSGIGHERRYLMDRDKHLDSTDETGKGVQARYQDTVEPYPAWVEFFLEALWLAEVARSRRAAADNAVQSNASDTCTTEIDTSDSTLSTLVEKPSGKRST